jgi:hypothetical protein
MLHADPERDDGEDRLRERHYYSGQKLDVACPVDSRGIENLPRNLIAEVGHGDEHVIGIDGGVDDHHQSGVQQAEVSHEKVGRDDPALEQHRQ